MADRRRLVSVNPDTGAVTTIRDLEDLSTVYSVRDSFSPSVSNRQTVWAQRQRRYGGARAVAESHANGTISFQSLVKGSSVDNAIRTLEGVLGFLETGRYDNLYLEWRPDGATSSVYWDIRGPATWDVGSTYRWSMMSGARAVPATISIPVAPLGKGDPVTINLNGGSSFTAPAVQQLATQIPGDAPAVADLTVRTTGGTSAPVWALIGWTQRPGTPLSGSVAPWGILEGESATLTNWATAADATARGGTAISLTTSDAGSASAYWPVDPSTMLSDDFSGGSIDVVVFARYLCASTVTTPVLTASLEPNAGTAFGAPRYTAEHQTVGHPVVVPSSGSRWRMARLGTLMMPVDPLQPLKWNLRVSGSWGAGSSGLFGLDYVIAVPARAHALGPTGKPQDTTYPAFIATTSDTTKRIRGENLSGWTASGTGNRGQSAGLGNSPIELPPGNVDVLVKLSSLVPGDPTASASSEQLSHSITSASLLVWPRYWLAA